MKSSRAHCTSRSLPFELCPPDPMKPEQLEIARLKREVIKLKAERNILKTHALKSLLASFHVHKFPGFFICLVHAVSPSAYL